jgi:hypothetical protein
VLEYVVLVFWLECVGLVCELEYVVLVCVLGCVVLVFWLEYVGLVCVLGLCELVLWLELYELERVHVVQMPKQSREWLEAQRTRLFSS